MANVIVGLIAGAVLGWLVTIIISRRHSILLLNIFIGSVGALVAGYLLLPFFHIDTSSFSLVGLLVSLVGSLILLAAVNFFFREHTMSNANIESQWDLVHDKIHSRWSKITEEEADQINGDHDQLINLIVERYGITNERAEDQLQSFLRAVTTNA
jgi:uncharacterized membrane protein YeaQ/YmgE (transglycosylase-associated protein family)/uncharacterized protein YjbJ (UPF0337 family)